MMLLVSTLHGAFGGPATAMSSVNVTQPKSRRDGKDRQLWSNNTYSACTKVMMKLQGSSVLL